MNHIEELFLEHFEPGYYKLIDRSHPLSIYIGADEYGHPAIEYIGNYQPIRVKTSSAISVQQTKSDGKYSIVFSLLDITMLSTFCAFCEDMVESTRNAADNSEGYNLLLNRFYAWIKMFRQQSRLLSENEIMGLIGELLFLKDELVPIYGEAKSISSWTGSEYTKKDFSLDNTWMEIKAINAGKPIVQIHSFEQLESDQDGHLVIYQLEKMSPEFEGVTIKKLVHQILVLLNIEELKDLFLLKIAERGYSFESEYDTYVYEIISKESYLVSHDFPCLRRMPELDAVVQVKYDLLLSKIEKFKE